MLCRIVRRFLPSSFQVLRTKTAQYTADCFKVSVHQNAPSVRIQDGYLYRLYSQKSPEAVTVSYEEVKNAVSNSSILIVDVREPDEVKEHGKIPNSINIPLGNVTTVLSTMSDKDFQKTYNRPKPEDNSEIIFYCMIGKRSGMAQQNAINLGFKNAKNYLGSWTDWASRKQ